MSPSARPATMDKTPLRGHGDTAPAAHTNMPAPFAATALPSVLFERAEDRPYAEESAAPACFHDLNLDQIVETLVAGRAEYGLKSFFHAPLKRAGAIAYRQDVLRDLEHPALFEAVKSFTRRMREMRGHLASTEKLSYRYQKERWFLETVETYCGAVEQLARDLAAAPLQSQGLLAFHACLTSYTGSSRFIVLRKQIAKQQADLSRVTYNLVLKDLSITVRKFEAEADYGAEVLATFEKFKQGDAKDYRVKYPDSLDISHIEAKIHEHLAALYPAEFSALDRFFADYQDYLDEAIGVFDREIQFYIAALEYYEPLKRAGLAICYPKISEDGKAIFSRDGFDVALAHRLVGQKATVVCNDFELVGAERILVVSGPNQGGKTTFARAFGQMHYLASIGFPVPGREARLFLFDKLFTHFEREEDITTLRGKLEDDLVRIHEVLRAATPDSIVVMNEIFTSTTLSDAMFLGREILGRIAALDALCVCVTFIDELAALNEKTVSMVSGVYPDNPAVRTYKIARRPADGLAYALAIAEKHRLTYARLRERLPS